MREHKYRAWHKQERKMYEVSVIHFGVQYGMAPSDSANLVLLCDKSQYYHEGQEVDLIEYTGLKDVAGKEIYECDILGIENASAKVVYWELPPEFGLDFSHNEDEWCEDWNLCDDHARMEIIGNIYENPELLEQKG